MNFSHYKNTFHIFDRKNSPTWWMWWTEPDGKRVQKSTGLPKAEYTREQAQARINEVSGSDSKPENKSFTLAWFVDYILDRIEREGVRESTLKEYKIALNHMKALYGDSYSLMKIKKDAVWRIQEYLLDKGNKPPTVNKVLRHLRGAFERLVDDETLDRNPFRKFRGVHEPNDKRKNLSLDELKRFLSIVNDSKNEAGKRLVRICVFTGIRRSEVLSIKRNDVDLINNRVCVQNIKHREKRKRWITIPDEVREHFEFFLKKNKSDTPFMVCYPDTLGDWTKEWMRQADLPEYFHLHSLRHTFITLAIENGTPIREIQRYVDHSDISVTEIYAHDTSDKGKSPNIGL